MLSLSLCQAFNFMIEKVASRQSVFVIIASQLSPAFSALQISKVIDFLKVLSTNFYVFSDRWSFQIRYAAFLKHGTGHAFKRLPWPSPATFIFCFLTQTISVALCLLAFRNTYCGNACFGEQVAGFKVRNFIW